MKIADIKIAKHEAERFLKCMKQFNDRILADDTFEKYWHITGGKESAALKRASLDLSRALSAMRGYK